LKATFPKIFATFQLQQWLIFNLDVNFSRHNHEECKTVFSLSEDNVAFFVLQQDDMIGKFCFLFGRKVLEKFDSFNQNFVA
jgi:hypothetical protein